MFVFGWKSIQTVFDMSLVVQKFGGTSLADVGRLARRLSGGDVDKLRSYLEDLDAVVAFCVPRICVVGAGSSNSVSSTINTRAVLIQ